MHNHTPLKCANSFVRFLRYLCSPVTVFRYYRDGTDICDVCNTHIALPFVYFCPIVNVIYTLAGIAIGFIVLMLPYLWLLGLILLVLLFHHIATSFIFAFFPWEQFDPRVRSTNGWCQEAEAELRRKATYIAYGLLIAVPFALIWH